MTGLADLLTDGNDGGEADDHDDVAVVGHGGVGTFWDCHLAGLAIDRRHDQPHQGHYFTFDLATRAVLHPWRPIDVPDP